jgi:hypothetical protein
MFKVNLLIYSNLKFMDYMSNYFETLNSHESKIILKFCIFNFVSFSQLSLNPSGALSFKSNQGHPVIQD